MLALILLVKLIANAIRLQVRLSLQGLQRISERVLDRQVPIWGRDEFYVLGQYVVYDGLQAGIE